MVVLTWIAIFLCLSQSAMLSGLNLGLFSLSKLELKVEARKGDLRAKRVLRIRERANFALATILWGNVAVNVLLALVSGSVLSGIAAFLFSTVVITVFAEIIPQAYFTRHALKMASLLAPLLRAYQLVLYPVARPSAWLLDFWLGGEEIRYFRERDLRRIIQLHMEAEESDISRLEGQGALNFLDIDDVPMDKEGTALDPLSIIELEFDGGLPVFPVITPSVENDFLKRINQSGKGWVVITDSASEPRLVLNSSSFIREALFASDHFDPFRHCHRPTVLKEGSKKLGDLLRYFTWGPDERVGDTLENDVILLWNEEPRVITGSDILGRLLRDIATLPKTSLNIAFG